MKDLDRNKQTVRSLYEEVLSSHRPELADELFAAEFPGGAGGFVAAIGELLRAFPDIRYTLLDLVAEGDRVAVRWQWTGTYREPFRNFAPTQGTITDTGMGVFTLSGGRIVGVEIQTDRLGFLQQIGVVPAIPGLRAAVPSTPRT